MKPPINGLRELSYPPPGKYSTSTLTLYEVIVILAGLTKRSLEDEAFIKEVIDAIINLRGLTIIPLEPAELINAVQLVSEYKIDYEDAIHLAAALKVNAMKMISNDLDFDKTPLKRIFQPPTTQ